MRIVTTWLVACLLVACAQQPLKPPPTAVVAPKAPATIVPPPPDPCADVVARSLDDEVIREILEESGIGGVLEATKSQVFAYNKYRIVHCPRLVGSQVYRIFLGDRIVEEGEDGAVHFGYDDPPPVGADITGQGFPAAAIHGYGVGAHCCTTVHFYEISDTRFRRLGTIGARDSEVAFRRVDGTPGLVAVLGDSAFAYWRTGFAGSPMPEVRLAFDATAGEYRFSPALMRAAPPPESELRAEAARLRAQIDVARNDPYRTELLYDVPVELWDRS